MRIGIPKEVYEGEKRVAATPESVQQLAKLGYTVAVEAGAGEAAKFVDDAFRDAGAEVVPDARQLWQSSDIVLKVRPPMQHPALGEHEADLLRDGSTLLGFIWPAQNPELLERFTNRPVSVIAMDAVPRISRAQKLDALSSMANIGGYRAVIEAAQEFGRFFTGQITAAGKVPPAKVMVIGAGVAGLAAIGTARSLGAIVRAFDVRPEVKEQIESMGAEFLELEGFDEEGSGTGGYAKQMSPEFIAAEMDLFARQAKDVDIIVTTALIPGKPAPKLITADMVQSMKQGSVIVDLASEQGGNCELTEPGRVAVAHGVKIIGYTDLPSRLPTQSSQLYATNLRHFLTDLTPEKNGEIFMNMEDDVIRGATVVREGEIMWPPPPPKVQAIAPAQTAKPAAGATSIDRPDAPKKGFFTKDVALILGAVALAFIGLGAPGEFLQHMTVFVLSCFVGYQLIWNVAPSLHTPLMSVTNAISGIIILGALLLVDTVSSGIVVALSAISLLIASINIAGGFLVTQRMLRMFRKD